MTQQQRETVDSIFNAALKKQAGDERESYLAQVCGNDTELRRRVDVLLKSYDDAGSFLETPAMDVAETFAVNHDDPNDTASRSDISLNFLTPSDKPECLGTLGQYEVLEVVGRGGMGVVLRANDGKLNRVVAIKVLAPELGFNQMAMKRFAREAQAAAAVSHDHVVTIHAVDEMGQTPFLVMEFVDGQSLQEKIDQGGALEVKEILRIGMQVAEGLGAAHRQGLIHRDIKPANILLENGVERVKLTDFGLARAVDDVAITQSGQISGTPQYMSPEQAQDHPIDHRTDLFSLGSVIYAMCTGRPPFRAESTVGTLRRVSDDTPRPIREINPDTPEWLAEVVDRLLAKNPDDRLQTADEVGDLLRDHLAHLQQPSVNPKPDRLEKRDDRPRPESKDPRHRSSIVKVCAICAGVLLILAIGVGLTEATGLTNFVATIIRVSTPEGTLIVEVDDPNISVAITGKGVSIAGAGPQEISVVPGKYNVVASKRLGDGHFAHHNELAIVRRGGRTIVKVTLERYGKSPTKSPPKNEQTNKPAKKSAFYQQCEDLAALVKRCKVDEGVTIKTVLGPWSSAGTRGVNLHHDRGVRCVVDGDWTRVDQSLNSLLIEFGRIAKNTKTIIDSREFHRNKEKQLGSFEIEYNVGGAHGQVKVEMENVKVNPMDNTFEDAHLVVTIEEWVRPHVKDPYGLVRTESPNVNDPKSPQLAQAPFNAEQAGHHQEAWAKHLGVPVEFTNSIGMKFRLIPPGEFMMGCDDDEINEAIKAAPEDRKKWAHWYEKSSGPRHKVRITQPIYMGVHEVTFAQFKSFVSETSYRTEAYLQESPEGTWWKPKGHPVSDEGHPVSDDRPVGNVSWNDVQEFCYWLGKKEGMKYALPTEAQWEFACRAGTETRWTAGDSSAKLIDHAWFALPVDHGPSPVGSKLPNAFGLHDLHGNVEEWCADWHHASFYTRSPIDDPLMAVKNNSVGRTIRGGSWWSRPQAARSAYRSYYMQSEGMPRIGFRVVIRDLSKAVEQITSMPTLRIRLVDDNILIDEDVYRLDSLKREFEDQVKANPSLAVLLLAEPTASAERVSEIMKLAQQAGIEDFKVQKLPQRSANETAVLLRTIETGRYQPLSVAFSPNNAWLASSAGDGTIRLWASSNAERRMLAEYGPRPVRSLVISPNGAWLAAAVNQQGFQLHRVPIPPLLQMIERGGPNTEFELPQKEMEVRCLAFSPDSKTLVTGMDKGVYFWDPVKRGPHKATFDVQQGAITAVAFSPDGKTLVSGSRDGTILLTQLDLSHESQIIQGQESPSKAHLNGVTSVVYSPDGELFASAGIDKMIKLWNPETAELLTTLEGHEKEITSIAFHPSGRLLASASADATVRLWDPETGKSLQVIREHTDQVHAIAFSSNGKMFSTASWDETVKLWDIALKRLTQKSKDDKTQN